MIKIYIINGCGGSGKDTFVDYCAEFFNARSSYNQTYNFSTITKIKNIAKLIGCNGKTEKDRKFLSDLKQLCNKYNDYAYNSVAILVDNLLTKHCKENNKENFLIFIHCREPKEITRFVENYGAETILVRRPNTQILSNSSDRDIENYSYDIIIENNSDLDNLNDLAYNFVKNII